MKKLVKLAVLLAASYATVSQAGIIEFDVSDADNNSGNSIGHGLYTFGKFGTGSASYSIQAGTKLTIDDKGTASNADDTATLTGTAKNGTFEAEIDLFLSGFQETMNYKVEQGKVYNSGHDIDDVRASAGNGDVDFFSSIQGTITINNVDFDIATCINCPNSTDLYGFQFGDGANAKNNSDFGASAWVGVGPNFDAPSHWDFNIKLTAVPAPATLALFGLGLLTLAQQRKRRIEV